MSVILIGDPLRTRGFRGHQCGGETGRALADDDEVLRWRAHDASKLPVHGGVCQTHRIFLR